MLITQIRLSLTALLMAMAMLLTPAPLRSQTIDQPAVQADRDESLIKRLHDHETKIRELKKEVESLKSEMAQLRVQNEAYKLAFEMLRDKPIVVKLAPTDAVEQNSEPGEAKDDDEDQAIAPPAADEPKWSLQYALGLIEPDGRLRIVHRDDHGRLSIRDLRSVDRNHVIVRGNIKNESTLPYRYTFEIRIAGGVRVDDTAILGSWRYQTPMMTPGRIHQFEVKVPVTNVADVRRYEIGNISADQPERIKKDDGLQKPAENKG